MATASYHEQINTLDFTLPGSDSRHQAKGLSAFAHIAEMHLDEVANLWTLWFSALQQPQYDRESLQELEQRIQAHIAGMRLQEEVTWDHCLWFLEFADGGEMFAATQLAFRSYDVEKIKAVVNAAELAPQVLDGLISAIAWLPNDIVSPWINKFLMSRQLLHKYIAVEACRLRRADLGELLDEMAGRSECTSHPLLGPSLLRSLGEFKHHNAVSVVDDIELPKETEFWRLYCQILLGEHQRLNQLRPFLFIAGIKGDIAMQLIFRCLPLDQAQPIISELAVQQSTMRAAVISVGILGDPYAIPWLIGVMRNPQLAQLAGQAFTMITGCNLESSDYTVSDLPESLEGRIRQETDHEHPPSVADGSLPWPDADAIWLAWQDILSAEYVSGVRYFMGEKINEELCWSVLENGKQNQRWYAAYELALINPAIGLYNTRGIQYPEP